MREGMARNGGYRIYAAVWAALIILTFLTVVISRSAAAGVTLIIALSIATVKAALIIYYFMNIRFEKGVLRLFIPLTAVLIAILITLVFTDVAYR